MRPQVRLVSTSVEFGAWTRPNEAPDGMGWDRLAADMAIQVSCAEVHGLPIGRLRFFFRVEPEQTIQQSRP
jgi:hypothetical protein